jgi:hypothetical protein
MNLMCEDIQVIDILTAISKRPNMYFGSRKEFLVFMWGYITGRMNSLPVPGPDFTQFELDMDSLPTPEWAASVVVYVRKQE